MSEGDLRLRSLFELHPDGICAVDLEGKLIEVNAACCRIFDCTASHLLQMQWLPMATPEHRERVDQHARQVVERGAQCYECSIIRPDGRLLDLNVTHVPIFTDEGVSGFYAVVRDVTHEKRAEAGLRFLSQVGLTLAASLDERTILAAISKLVVSAIASYCVIVLTGEDGQGYEIFTALPTNPNLTNAMSEARRLEGHIAPEISRVLGTGRPEVLSEVPETLLALIRQTQLASVTDKAAEPRSAMLLPLLVRGRAVGVIFIASVVGGQWNHRDDHAIAIELAGRVALALDHARQHRQRSEIAHTLQQCLLPPALPEVPGLELGATYHSAYEGADVGGDFYDVFQTTDGSWVAMIGDVTGKGPAAAALTAMIRHTARAITMRVRSLGEVLARLNEAMLPQVTDEQFCTIVILRLERKAGQFLVHVASGGHPLPLLLHADGSLVELGSCGPFVGALPEMSWSEQTLELKAGDTMLLHTDGVTEARSPNGDFFGGASLAALFRSCGKLTPAELVAGIKQVVIQFQHGNPRDDLALLSLRVSASNEVDADQNQSPTS